MRFFAILMISVLLLTGCSPSTPAETTAGTTEPIVHITIPQNSSQPTTAPSDAIANMVQSMTTEEKVGQLFLARCPDANQIEDIQTYRLGGYILFGKDFDNQTPQSISDLIASFQSASSIPMLIAVDEEGGTVCRISYHPAFRCVRFPSPRNAFMQGGIEYVLNLETEKAALLSGMGINVNMAPVCDITTTPTAFMYHRSLGQSPELTAQFVVGAINRAEPYGIGCVLKHFPGYGDNTDTHTAIAIDDRSLPALESRDLIPFQAGIDAGCGAILVSHTFISCLDQEYPATLSPAVHDYLRNTMGFDGVIVTDDLVMNAITNLYGDGEAAVLAVLAGNDLLCCTNYREQYTAVLNAVFSGRISQEILDQAVIRILRWKQSLGLLPE